MRLLRKSRWALLVAALLLAGVWLLSGWFSFSAVAGQGAWQLQAGKGLVVITRISGEVPASMRIESGIRLSAQDPPRSLQFGYFWSDSQTLSYERWDFGIAPIIPALPLALAAACAWVVQERFAAAAAKARPT